MAPAHTGVTFVRTETYWLRIVFELGVCPRLGRDLFRREVCWMRQLPGPLGRGLAVFTHSSAH